MAAAAARSGFRRMFSISAFSPRAPTPPPKADPSPNLFVSGLSKRTTTEGLRETFAKFGEVVQARVVADRVTGFSKGFGFVRYTTVEDAAKGIEGMDGKMYSLHSLILDVLEAQMKEKQRQLFMTGGSIN